MAVVSNVAPYIDPNVQHVGVSKLRGLSASKLSDMKRTLVIQDNDSPLAVLVRYEQYMAIQEQIKSLKETIQILTDEGEKAAMDAGLKELSEGRVRTLSDVRASGRAKEKDGQK
jgi:hypothetical protein